MAKPIAKKKVTITLPVSTYKKLEKALKTFNKEAEKPVTLSILVNELVLEALVQE